MANGWRASRRLDKRSCERYPQVTAKLAREELWYNARNMLRHKKAWRRLFGLRGDLWYYSEEAGNKEYLLKIAQFIVPFLAITVSGILSYKAIVFNQESFAAQHQPKLSVEGVIYYQQFFDGMARTGLEYRVYNRGETEASDVHVIGRMWPPKFTQPVGWEFRALSIKAGSSRTQILDMARIPPEDFILYVDGDIYFKNSKGEEQGPSHFCFAWALNKGMLPCR